MTTYPTLAGDEWIRGRIVEEKGMEPIKFYAEVAKVQTTVDGIRVVLDLGEPGIEVMRALAECKQNGVVLNVEATPKR